MLDLNFDFDQGSNASDRHLMLNKFFNMLNTFAVEGNISSYQALVEFQLGYKKPVEEFVIRYVRDRVEISEQSERTLASLKQIFSDHEKVRCHELAYQRLRGYIVNIVQTKLLAEAVAHDQARQRRLTHE